MQNIAAIKQNLTRAHARAVAEEKERERQNNVQEMGPMWDTVTHILLSFFLVVVVSLGLTLIDHAAGPTPVSQDVISESYLGRVHKLLGVQTAHAASGYLTTGIIVEPSENLTLRPGESQAIRARMRNTGTKTWTQEEGAYLSLYTYDPKYHPSELSGPSWRSNHQTGRLIEAEVPPGQVGVVEFFVYAPQTPGTYTETWQLAAEDRAWVEGGDMQITLNVVGEPVVAEETAPVVEEPAPVAPSYAGLPLIMSARRVVAAPNAPIAFNIGFKNSGESDWDSYELRSMQVTSAVSAGGAAVPFYHPSWLSRSVATSNPSASVEAGSLEFVTFQFRAPNTAGVHTANFQLYVDDVEVPGAFVEIPVEVTGNAPALLDAPLHDDTLPYRAGEMVDVPRVRVGIDQVQETEVVMSATTDVRVVESEIGYERLVVPANQPIRVRWNGSRYLLQTGDESREFVSFLRFEGEGPETIFTVSSFEDIRSWNTSYNDNRFRDTMEIRYNATRDRTWLINELDIEHYLYGLDETSNTAPFEYHKAIATAGRTYAEYARQHEKYRGEGIDLRSTTYDQVYHGYGAEVRRPNFVRAIDATRGVTIEYEGETIIASYFSRSDGRTRNWSDVWGRHVPYAVAVEVPCESGSTKWGHGVGMSAHGAVCMAEDEGASWDEILHHFYTGVELVRHWE